MPADKRLINPVLPGFHPDPSLLRVGSDFYIATSTFEWWPGVRIHHSRDLVHWRHLSYALTRRSQLDLRGTPDSCGVWAPCLSHHDGVFYLLFTHVHSLAGACKDTHNFVVTASDPVGPWSDARYLNSSGFDPSLFHDTDGRSWMLNMRWNHRVGANPFHDIVMQQFDREQRALVGPLHTLFEGSAIGFTEGPHLYRRDGWYLLMVAEGGTSFHHAVTVARSRELLGPYELPAAHPLLSGRGSSPAGLQKAGHASLCDTPQGEWLIAHLAARPLEWQADPPPQPPADYDAAGLHCNLGRETAIQFIEWTADGWPRLRGGGQSPRSEWPAPALPACPWPAEAEHDDFDAPELNPHLNALRGPFDADQRGPWWSLHQRPGHLRLWGRESLASLHRQSLLARRQQHFNCEVDTVVEFAPTHFQQMAGLVSYYNSSHHAYLHLTHQGGVGPLLLLTVTSDGVPSEPAAALPVGTARRVGLRVRFGGGGLQFSARLDDADWFVFGPELPARLFSDEAATCFENGYARSFGFTGNFIGLACQDLSGARLHADFDCLSYRPLPP